MIIIASNSNSIDIEGATPPKLNIKELITHSDNYFSVKLIKETIFELSYGYNNVLGYKIILQKK